jgi:hypothetical protein
MAKAVRSPCTNPNISCTNVYNFAGILLLIADMEIENSDASCSATASIESIDDHDDNDNHATDDNNVVRLSSESDSFVFMKLRLRERHVLPEVMFAVIKKRRLSQMSSA